MLGKYPLSSLLKYYFYHLTLILLLLPPVSVLWEMRGTCDSCASCGVPDGGYGSCFVVRDFIVAFVVVLLSPRNIFCRPW